MKKYTRVLTIAGSDSGGGAGIQADLKTFSACGCYGMSVITAITAQNTVGVTDIHPIPPSTISKQLEAVFSDIGVDSVKIGMLHSTAVIEAVASALKKYPCPHIVADPVMVATSGDRLIEEDAVNSLIQILLPLSTLITPNIPEAEILLGEKITTADDLPAVANKLATRFSTSVLAKGGHLPEDLLTDVLWDNTENKQLVITNTRQNTPNTHGTGCTLSSAVASFLAQENSIQESVKLGEEYLHKAIISGAEFSLGKGSGPVNHFHNVW